MESIEIMKVRKIKDKLIIAYLLNQGEAPRCREARQRFPEVRRWEVQNLLVQGGLAVLRFPAAPEQVAAGSRLLREELASLVVGSCLVAEEMEGYLPAYLGEAGDRPLEESRMTGLGRKEGRACHGQQEEGLRPVEELVRLRDQKGVVEVDPVDLERESRTEEAAAVEKSQEPHVATLDLR